MKTMKFDEFFNKNIAFEGLTEKEAYFGETMKLLLYILVMLTIATIIPVAMHIPLGIDTAFLQW